MRGYCRGRATEADRAEAPERADEPASPLLAANGDVLVDALLAGGRDQGAPLLGHVQADHASGLELLRRGAVLVTGCHGGEVPSSVPDVRLARIHLAEREVGLVFRRGMRLRRVSGLVGRRLATRPPTAGIRAHLDRALRDEGIEPEQAYAGASLHPSHAEVAMAVVRGDAEIGLTSRGWAIRAGLAFLALGSEAYGLVLRAGGLGDPRLVALGEVAQSAAFRRKLRADFGYDARRTGEIRVGKAPGAER